MSDTPKTVKREYTGYSGASVSNKYGTWDIRAPKDSEYSAVKDVPADEAYALQPPMFIDPAKKAKETATATKKK